MHVDKISNLSFESGNVRLVGIPQKSLYTFDSIKKIAEDRGIDIFISKNKSSKTIVTNRYNNKRESSVCTR